MSDTPIPTPKPKNLWPSSAAPTKIFDFNGSADQPVDQRRVDSLEADIKEMKVFMAEQVATQAVQQAQMVSLLVELTDKKKNKKKNKNKSGRRPGSIYLRMHSSVFSKKFNIAFQRLPLFWTVTGGAKMAKAGVVALSGYLPVLRPTSLSPKSLV